MNRVQQTFALLGLTLASLRERLGASLVLTLGVAYAVGVLISMLAIGAGIDTMVTKNVSADRIIVRDAGGNVAAELAQADIPSMQALAGVRRNALDQPLVSADVLVSVQARWRACQLDHLGRGRRLCRSARRESVWARSAVGWRDQVFPHRPRSISSNACRWNVITTCIRNMQVRSTLPRHASTLAARQTNSA